MRYHFVAKKNGCTYFVKGIDNHFYIQADSKEEIKSILKKEFPLYLELNFTGYNVEQPSEYELENDEDFLLEFVVPSDTAFDLIMRQTEKNYPGGKEALIKDLELRNQHEYHMMFRRPMFNAFQQFDKIRALLPNFPFHWIFD